MADEQTYECANCGKKKEQSAKESIIPECCGKTMLAVEPLDVCQTSTTAEHSRFDDLGEPCDDGRAGS